MLKTLPVALILTGLLLAAPSFGHAKLINSLPASGAQVTDAPKTLTLSFNEGVNLAALTLTREGKEVPVTVDKSVPAAKTIVVPVSSLTAGSYVIHWTAISADDGHVTKGSFMFTVVGAAPAH